MAGTINNIRNWAGAVANVGPLGTTAPTDVASALNAAFHDVGFLDEDNGIEQATARSVTDHYAYGQQLLRSTVKGEKHTVKFWMLEETISGHALINPGGTIVTASSVSTVSLKNWQTNPLAWVFELTDGAIIERLSVPRGEVVEPPEYGKLTDDGIAMVGVTVTCYSVAGVWGKKITTNPALTTA